MNTRHRNVRLVNRKRARAKFRGYNQQVEQARRRKIGAEISGVGYGLVAARYEFAEIVRRTAKTIGVEPQALFDNMKELRRQRWLAGEQTPAEAEFYGDDFASTHAAEQGSQP